jgi:predicted transcriptional regulator
LSNLTQNQINDIYKLSDEGYKSRAIGKKIGCSKSTVNNYLSKREGGVSVDLPEIEDKDLEVFCDSSDKHIASLAKRLRTAQKTNTQLRKTINGIADDGSPRLEEIVSALTTKLNNATVTYPKVPDKPRNKRTVEILFSDLQIGKISEHWNTEIALRTLDYYGKEVLREVVAANPERIIFASLGDLCECMLKHGIQSAISTDTSNAEQMANAIEAIWWKVLAPLIALNIPMKIVGVQGNHLSSTGKGMDMFKAGRYGYDYVMYKSWENMVKVSGETHVTFNIPEGNFATYEIYGKLTVAEHGYEAKGSSETALMALRTKRATNMQKYVHRLVVGDLHHYCNYDNGNIILNGAFFGVAENAIEYSGIMGYHAVPAQVVVIHEPTTGVGQNTVVEVKTIQVAKGYYSA